MAKRDYLVEAAKQIRMALDSEVNEDYEAFNCFTVDPNKERREAVKRKTTQYLKRAEEIFITHLQDNFVKGSSHLGGYSSLRFRPIRHLSSPVEDLEMCKVVGVTDKSLVKSSWESRDQPTIIPQGVPYMIKLLRYYVSEDIVYLHLEHVKGLKSSFPSSLPIGELWDSLLHRGNRLPPEHTVRSQHSHPSTRTLCSSALLRPCQSSPKCHVRTQFEESGNGTDRVSSATDKSMQNCWGLPEAEVRVWGAQILLALESLHQQGILCRDLNPRNVLLTGNGKVCLTFFGQWSEVQSEICSKAMEQMYCAPGRHNLIVVPWSAHPRPPQRCSCISAH
uniref:Protein kinase domain-containing protein n=1 Tax=Mola mola TaxID=94237 RepID=A0A3Q3VMC8_MOLML